MAKDEKVNLYRELFDTKVNIIIEKTKLKQNKEKLEELKEDFRKISCEIVEIRKENANLNFQVTSCKDWNEPLFNSSILSTSGTGTSSFLNNNSFDSTSTTGSAKSLKSNSSVKSTVARISQKQVFKHNDLHFFVGKLSQETDERSLQNYFRKFGPIDDLHIPKTFAGKSRGFGYITFSDFYDKSPLHQHHVIDGSIIRLDKVSTRQQIAKSDKIAVSGNLVKVSTEDLNEYFSRFGKIINITRHKNTDGTFKRFAIITFEKFEDVDRVVNETEHVVKGKIVDCQRTNN